MAKRKEKITEYQNSLISQVICTIAEKGGQTHTMECIRLSLSEQFIKLNKITLQSSLKIRNKSR